MPIFEGSRLEWASESTDRSSEPADSNANSTEGMQSSAAG